MIVKLDDLMGITKSLNYESAVVVNNLTEAKI